MKINSVVGGWKKERDNFYRGLIQCELKIIAAHNSCLVISPVDVHALDNIGIDYINLIKYNSRARDEESN